MRNSIYQKAKKLQRNGHPIAIQWTSSHSGLPRNKRADLTTKAQAEKGGKLLEHWSSFAYIKKNLVIAYDKKITQWYKTKM